MNARQKKKATTGKSPRLVERLLGLPRGSCLDCVSFNSPGKVRSYHGVRFKPTGLPLVSRSVERDSGIDMGRASFSSSPLYLDCDGNGVLHKVDGFTDADGVKHVTLDGQDIGYADWKRLRDKGRFDGG